MFVRTFLISPHMKIHVCWKDVLHQLVNTVLTQTMRKKKYFLHLAKILYHRLHNRAQTVTEKCCIAYCSLFMRFIHCRHSFVIYAVSKQHKHHSMYPSLCHCYEPGHFATFPQPVPLQNHFHTQDCISQTVWSELMFAPVLMY